MHARPSVWLLAILLLVVSTTSGSAAPLEKPQYTRGDSWTYETHLAESFGLSFEGNTTITAGDVVPMTVQGTSYETLEISLSGGGAFAGDLPFLGRVDGTWTLTGVDHWETGGWNSVRSFLRLTAEGTFPGPTPIPFTFEIVNETTRRVTGDTFPWPIQDAASGETRAHWNVSQNITFEAQGSPPGWDHTWIDADLVTTHERVGAERVTVPAGSFDTDRIAEVGPEGGHRERWFSGRVGADVREYDYNRTGGRVASTELVRYRYAAGTPAPAFPWVFAVLAGLVAAIAILALVAFRRRKPVDVWMPPERDEGGRSP